MLRGVPVQKQKYHANFGHDDVPRRGAQLGVQILALSHLPVDDDVVDVDDDLARLTKEEEEDQGEERGRELPVFRADVLMATENAKNSGADFKNY